MMKTERISVTKLTGQCIKTIEQKNKEINAFITISAGEALKKAEKLDEEAKKGALVGPLFGVPVAVKDNICTKGIKTTCGSKMLENYIPEYNAMVIDRLEAAGAIIIGKTNMDEFAMGSTTQTSYYGETRNPYNCNYSAGGSSGGTAAAIAGGMVSMGLGSDTGGSIRLPGAYCGVTGIKPTYGVVSRYGLVAYASGFDQIGPMATNVKDCVTLLDVIAGYDSKDSTSIKTKDIPYGKYLTVEVGGLRIAVIREYMNRIADKSMKAAIHNALDGLKKAGAIVEEVSLKYTEYAVPAYYIIASAQASSNLARFDGVKYGYRAKAYDGLHDMYKKSRSEGFGLEAKRRIMLGAFVLSSGYYEQYYLKALKIRNLIKQEHDRLFSNYDIIAAPVAPTGAPLIGEYKEDIIKMYDSDIFNVTANLLGLPALNLPVGKTDNGLPAGMQFIGNCFREDNIIRAAYACEQLVRE